MADGVVSRRGGETSVPLRTRRTRARRPPSTYLDRRRRDARSGCSSSPFCCSSTRRGERPSRRASATNAESVARPSSPSRRVSRRAAVRRNESRDRRRRRRLGRCLSVVPRRAPSPLPLPARGERGAQRHRRTEGTAGRLADCAAPRVPRVASQDDVGRASRWSIVVLIVLEEARRAAAPQTDRRRRRLAFVRSFVDTDRVLGTG